MRAIPLPLIQIALGALIAWPQAGCTSRSTPSCSCCCSFRRCCLPTAGAFPSANSLPWPAHPAAGLGLVLFTVLGLGYLIHWMIPEIPLTVAFALAAVISPTDAVAVSAITRNLGMPRRPCMCWRASRCSTTHRAWWR
jgi:CPA1 family monovalent cation:H+ antiporter